MDDRIKKTLDYIEDHLSLTLGLADLAEIACMSPSQFHRAFKKETGSTPFKFIEEIKMNKAHQLLVHEGTTMVHKLAADLGYKDYETLTRAFKKYFFLSPDDLKSIANRLKENLNPTEKDGLFITTLDNIEDLEAIQEKIDQIILEKGISKEDLENAKFFMVTEKSDSTTTVENLIKNKYEFEISNSKKIWQSLIDQKIRTK